MSFAITPKAKGDEEKMATRSAGSPRRTRRLPASRPADRRGDPLRHEPDARRGGARARSGASAWTSSSTRRACRTGTQIRRSARARLRQEADGKGRGQFGDATIVVSPFPDGEYEFVDKIVGGVIPQGLARGRQGYPGGDAPRRARRAPRCGRATSSSTARTTPSIRRRWRSRSPARWRGRTQEERRPGTARAHHGDRGDGAGRRRRCRQRRPQLAARKAPGMEPRRADDDQGRGADGGAPHVLAVAHLDDRRPRRLPMHFLRYEEVPTHVAQKVIDETKREREAAKA